MPTLKNTTGSDLHFTGGVTVPANGRKDVSDDAFKRLSRKDQFFQRKMRSGDLAVYASVADLDKWAGDIDAAEPITREDIAKMKRAELLDVILAHYDDEITADDFSGVTVEDKDGEDGLRTIARRILFAEG